MAELFGSATPIWSAVPAFGFVQTPATMPTPMTTGGRPPIGATTATFGGPQGTTDVSGFVPAPLGTAFPGIADVAVGVTAHMLLNTVAMRRGQPLGPTNDHEVEEFLYDALELLPGAAEVDVRCDGGRVALTGAVPNKRLKRDVGEIAWAIPSVNDVQNNVTVTARRRSRPAGREGEASTTVAGRKQS